MGGQAPPLGAGAEQELLSGVGMTSQEIEVWVTMALKRSGVQGCNTGRKNDRSGEVGLAWGMSDAVHQALEAKLPR